MTTQTPNLLLTLYNDTTDSSATFLAFRTAVAGIAVTSNFYKIDTAYGDMDTRVSDLESQLGVVGVSANEVSANTYTASVAAIDTYVQGMTIILSLDTDISGTSTLNINSLGAKGIKKTNSSGTIVDVESGDLRKGVLYLFTYDVDRWIWVSANTAKDINISGTAGDIVLVASDNTLVSASSSTFVGDAIHNATGKTTPVDADEVGISDSAASYALKKVTWTNIKATLKTYFDTLYDWAVATHAATGKTTPVDADELSIVDSAASNVLKKLTWANLKATYSSSSEALTNKTMIASSNVIEQLTTYTSNATLTPTGGSLRNRLKVTALAEAATIAEPSGTPVDGNMLMMRIVDNGTARALSYNAIYRDVGVTRKTTTTINKTLYQLAVYNSAASKWDIISVVEET